MDLKNVKIRLLTNWANSFFSVAMISGRFASVDYIRGLAATMILIHHISLGKESGPVIHRLLYECRLGVQVFFIISGFVIPYSLWASKYRLRNFTNFLLKRALRIDPPMWIVILLIFLFGTSYNSCDNLHLQNFEDLKILFLNIFYLVPFSTTCWYESIFWTLGIEFQFYVIIGLIFPFLVKNKINIHLTLVASLLIWAHSLINGLSNFFILSHLVYFLTGLVLFLFQVKKISATEALVWLTMLITAAEFAYSSKTIAMFMIVTVLLFYVKIDISLLKNLGLISYSLYLTHPFVLHISKKIVQMPDLALIVSQLTLSILFAIFFYMYIEKQFILASKKLIKIKSSYPD